MVPLSIDIHETSRVIIVIDEKHSGKSNKTTIIGKRFRENVSSVENNDVFHVPLQCGGEQWSRRTPTRAPRSMTTRPGNRHSVKAAIIGCLIMV